MSSGFSKILNKMLTGFLQYIFCHAISVVMHQYWLRAKVIVVKVKDLVQGLYDHKRIEQYLLNYKRYLIAIKIVCRLKLKIPLHSTLTLVAGVQSLLSGFF